MSETESLRTTSSIHEVALRYIELREQHAELLKQRLKLLLTIDKEETLIHDYLVQNNLSFIKLDDDKMIELRPEFTSDEFPLHVHIRKFTAIRVTK